MSASEQVSGYRATAQKKSHDVSDSTKTCGLIALTLLVISIIVVGILIHAQVGKFEGISQYIGMGMWIGGAALWIALIYLGHKQDQAKNKRKLLLE